MTEAKLIKTINTLLILASFFLLYGVLEIILKPKTPEIREHDQKIEKQKEEEKEVIERFPVRLLTEEAELRNLWHEVTVTYTTIEFEYICRGYITAYCAEECNSDMTASGIRCHYTDDPYEPTTVAIDRRYYHFGDLFWIDGKLYVAEDTGSAVLGNHWDVYRPDYQSMAAHGSHYTDVYSVSYENHIIERKVRFNDYFNFYLLCSDIRGRCVPWSCS